MGEIALGNQPGLPGFQFEIFFHQIYLEVLPTQLQVCMYVCTKQAVLLLLLCNYLPTSYLVLDSYAFPTQ